MKGFPPFTEVKSAHLDAIAHRGSSLFVKFKSGGVWEYKDVPSAVFHEGVAADSPGSWFGKSVKGKFLSTKHDG